MTAPTSPWIERGARVAAGGWLLGIAGALLAGALGGGAAAWVAEDGPVCPFRALTGVSCALCGMTHAVVALGRGDLGAALGHHPLAPALVLVDRRAVRGGRARPCRPGCSVARDSAPCSRPWRSAWIANLSSSMR